MTPTEALEIGHVQNVALVLTITVRLIEQKREIAV
jgi:hypothetical protein